MLLLGLLAVREYMAMIRPLGTQPLAVGYPIVAAFAVAALVDGREQAGLGVVAAAVGLPLIAETLRFARRPDGALLDWSLALGGALWIGLPIFAAVALRERGGTVDADWVRSLSDGLSLSLADDGAPRGLAWLVTIILITWLGDTGAYLVGRAAGRRSLLPAVSPKKTVEGSIGGLLCSGLIGAAAIALFGLGIAWWWGFAIGIVLGALGQVGDLAESMIKREAKVKDSGSLIPGHGGVLDRIDALLFTLTGGWFLASFVDRIVL